MIDDVEADNKAPTQKSLQVHLILDHLKLTSQVVVPTDKTNSFRTMYVQDYVNQVIKHLDQHAIEISRAKAVELYKKSETLLADNKWMLSDNERGYLSDKIQSKAIPQPKILIKDHKKKGPDGNYPSHLVIPATNFTAGFSQLVILESSASLTVTMSSTVNVKSFERQT